MAEQVEEAPQPKRSTGFIIPKKAPPVEQPEALQPMLQPEAVMGHAPQPMAMRYPQPLPSAPQAPWYAPAPAAPLAHSVAYEPYVPQMPQFVAPPPPPPPPAVAFRTGAFDPRRVRAAARAMRVAQRRLTRCAHRQLPRAQTLACRLAPSRFRPRRRCQCRRQCLHLMSHRQSRRLLRHGCRRRPLRRLQLQPLSRRSWTC